MKLIYINFSTTHTDAEAIMIHNITPCRSGFTPTVFKVSLDKAAPIKNNVSVSPILSAMFVITTLEDNNTSGLIEHFDETEGCLEKISIRIDYLTFCSIKFFSNLPIKSQSKAL